MVVPTVATAVAGSVVAVVINLATEWKRDPLAWLAVALFTGISAVIALWLDHHRQAP